MPGPLAGLYRLPLDERRRRVADLADLTPDEVAALAGTAGLTAEAADGMVENALGVHGLPLGVCANLVVDGRPRLVPMAVEEPSVIAAASHAARLMAAGGGVRSRVGPSHMVGQLQVLDVPDPAAAERAVLQARGALLARANTGHDRLRAAGGGAFDVEVRHLPPLDHDDPLGPMLVVHLLVDVRDAMGANAINSMCERLAPTVERLTGGRVRLRILSNLADRRRVQVTTRIPVEVLGKRGDGPDVARGIEEASVFAERDPYRAATHNKGIMNGVDAALIALGQDWRAVEAGAHAFAAQGGRYTALARWRVRGGHLEGALDLPLAVGTVGGVVRVHPTVRAALRVAGVADAADLARLVAAVGLAQNLGALRALAAEGIQRGHMRLHARNVAAEAGATADELDVVAARIADAGTIHLDAARDALAALRRRSA